VKASTLIATVFGAGLLKPAPGTWGSAAGLVLAYPLMALTGPTGLFCGFVAVTALGVWASEIYARQSRLTDPSEVVIDEVAGLWFTLLFTPFTPVGWILAFALFRLFDIWKPWPISVVDRRIKGGVGIMLDDLLAGLLAAVVVFALALVSARLGYVFL
jgi:phosphatidylglycerophosphatase A